MALRLLAAAVLAATLAACSTETGAEGQASASTAPTTTTRQPMVGQPGYSYPSRTTTPPTTRPRAGDGICSAAEQGSNSPDCDPDAEEGQEVPAWWVPCGETGARCPPGYDTPALASYDPAPGRRWSYADELEYELRLRAVLERLARSNWPRTRLGTYDHSWPNDPGPGSASRPIQPYRARFGDPNDADGDGVACEYGCLN